VTKRILLFAVLLGSFTCFVTAQYTSSYTSLHGKNCRKLKPIGRDVLDRERCTGLAGFKLDHLWNEDIDWIELITPAGKRFSLGAPFTMPGYMGPTLEWRLRNGRPIALVARYTLVKPDDMKKKLPTMVVSKITPTSACVTDVIEPSKDQNLTARRLADSASSRPCRPTN
jgi:hypothetical protein